MLAKVDKEISTFLEKIQGTDLDSLVLSVSATGIKGTHRDTKEARIVNFDLKKESTWMVDYKVEQDERLAIPTLGRLIQFIKNCDVLFTFQSTADKLILKSNTEKSERTFEYLLCDEKYIVDGTRPVDLTYYNNTHFNMKVPTTLLQKIQKNIAVIDCGLIRFSREGDKLKWEAAEKAGNKIIESWNIDKTTAVIKNDKDFSFLISVNQFNDVVKKFTLPVIDVGVIIDEINVLEFTESSDNWYFQNFIAEAQEG